MAIQDSNPERENLVITTIASVAVQKNVRDAALLSSAERPAPDDGARSDTPVR
jgi:hypothetical protein